MPISAFPRNGSDCPNNLRLLGITHQSHISGLNQAYLKHTLTPGFWGPVNLLPILLRARVVTMNSSYKSIIPYADPHQKCIVTENMKLLYMEQEYWSISPNIIYFDIWQLSKRFFPTLLPQILAADLGSSTHVCHWAMAIPHTLLYSKRSGWIVILFSPGWQKWVSAQPHHQWSQSCRGVLQHLWLETNSQSLVPMKQKGNIRTNAHNQPLPSENPLVARRGIL